MTIPLRLSEYTHDVNLGIERSITTRKNKQCTHDEFLSFWIDETYARRENGGTFFFAGNGASATMAEHLSHDCFQNGNMKTDTCSETAHITAIANDLSFEDVFSYRIGKLAGPDDMLITISASGNSPNIVKAIKTAKEKGAYVVTLSGMNEDNQSRQLGELNFYVPLPTYGTVETAHALLLHCWLDLFMDKYMGGRH